MKPHARTAFGQILRNLALINSQGLARKAELAASLAGLYRHCRQRLLRIEQSARDQIRVINESTLGPVAATA